MIILAFLLICFLVLIRLRRQQNVVAFFHPYCNAGGGGERVLWCAISSLQKKFPRKKYVLFTGDRDASKEQILLKAKQRFGIEVDPDNLIFVYLRTRRLVEADLYPYFTMILQGFFGFILGCEALIKVNPEIYIDSMGFPFTLPLFKYIAGAKVAAYVHYPTISYDMIDMVSRREERYNNSSVIVRSSILSYAKMIYYNLFALIYGFAGRSSDIVIANGSWTSNHLKLLWKRVPFIVFPPCDVSSLLLLEQTAESCYSNDNIVRIISVGQIRPEKNHKLQIEIIHDLKPILLKQGLKVQLTIAGGCRGSDDEKRASDLKAYAQQLELEDNVKFLLNVPFDDLLEALSKSMISIHTMIDEHFGISVVEGLAAGTLMVAHNSAGPKLDIISNKSGTVGFLANTKEEYVEKIQEIISKTKSQRDRIREAARDSTKRFSETNFDKQFTTAITSIF